MTKESVSPTPLPVPGTPPDAERIQAAFVELVQVVARLRAPDGCPWDRAQTLATIKPYTLEETFEVFEAIDTGDDAGLTEELGDLLLQVVLYAQIAADEGKFDLIPVVEGITQKMLRRHPHVFGRERAETAEQVLHHWDRAKQQEKLRESVLDGVTLALPALARTIRLSSKAARAGYDLPDAAAWREQVAQEWRELESRLATKVESSPNASSAATDSGAESSGEKLESEFGELLFAVANLARQAGINPEDALRKTNRRFEERVRGLEKELSDRQGRSLRSLAPEEAIALYRTRETGAD